MLKATRQLLYDWTTYRRNQRDLAELDAHLRSEQPTMLVHQMGRAGSMTVVNSLREACTTMPVFHTHWLNPRNIQRRVDHFKGRPEHRLPFNVRMGMRVARALQENGPGTREWHIVTVFREPIARNISVFFLSIEDFVKDFFRRHARGEVSNAEILDAFMTRFPHDQPLVWFDEEVRDIFGLDVFEHPFPQTKGHQIIRSGNINMLLLKLEQLNSSYRTAFDEFMDIRVEALEQTHITEKNPAYSMYRDFTNWVTLPRDYLDRMYDSAFATHFYSPEELQGFRARWGQRQAGEETLSRASA